VTHTAYDLVRYPGKFYPQSSADRLATLGHLCGLRPAPPARCRLLELGCGDGGNLIPQAVAFPGSHFLGIDLAASAVEEGRRTIEALGLTNVDLRTADLTTFDPGPARFDYITAHGVLSWVPFEAREALLKLCGRFLAPDGVAYVSYSALPGAYLRNVPRDLMRFHTRALTDPRARVRAAREVVEFMGAAMPGNAFARELLEREMAGSEGKDYFLLHDLLAEENEPLYFLDFMDAAREHGLQFLAEAEFGAMWTGGFPPGVQRQLDAVATRLEREQYLDFLHLRRFRQTLLCHEGHGVDLAVTPERLASLNFSTLVRAAGAAADAGTAGPLEFRHPYHGSFRTDDPIAKAVCLALSRGDRGGMSFADLVADASRVLGEPGRGSEAASEALVPALLSLYARDLIEIHAVRWRFSAAPSAWPRAGAHARMLAERGQPVVNAAHGAVLLPTPFLRRLLPLLDGTRTHDELLEALVAVTPPEEREQLTPGRLQRGLRLLADNALLLD
jgi:SAM-dependent methyltransferase